MGVIQRTACQGNVHGRSNVNNEVRFHRWRRKAEPALLRLTGRPLHRAGRYEMPGLMTAIAHVTIRWRGRLRAILDIVPGNGTEAADVPGRRRLPTLRPHSPSGLCDLYGSKLRHRGCRFRTLGGARRRFCTSCRVRAWRHIGGRCRRCRSDHTGVQRLLIRPLFSQRDISRE